MGSIQCWCVCAVQPNQKSPMGTAMEPSSIPGIRNSGLGISPFFLVNYPQTLF